MTSNVQGLPAPRESFGPAGRLSAPSESRDKDKKLRVYSKLGYVRSARTAGD